MNRSLPQQINPLRSRRGSASVWLLALLLAAAGGLICLLFWQLFNPALASNSLEISLLSKRVADYSADPRSLNFPLKEASILGDILQDKHPYAADLPVRLATLKADLDEPIPTATPVFQGFPPPPEGATSTPLPAVVTATSATLTASATEKASLTPTQTLTGKPTLTLTATGKVTLTATPTCTPTTSATPNCTPTPSVTAKASPTQTRTPNPAVTAPIIPSATWTATPTSTSTSTQAPVIVPTDTNTPVPTKPPTPTSTTVPVVIPTLTTCNAIPANSLAAVADSYVDKTKADQNFGKATTLYIRPTAGIDKRALIKFDLGSIPAGSQVLAAILYIYNDQADNYVVNILQVTSPWDEMSVTWNNQPPTNAGSAVGSFQLTTNKCTRGAFISNALVQSWVDDPGSNNGIMLYPPSGAGDVWFCSREGTQAPQLYVVYQ